MNLPNILSLFRLFITIFFILFMLQDRYRLALGLFVVQGISDALDGYFARRMGIKTELGAYLDPLADKIMLASSYLVLCFKEIVPVWLMSVVIVRDAVITGGFLFLYRLSIRRTPAPSHISKATTLVQIVTVIYLLWSTERSFAEFFFYATAFFTAVSGVQYIFAGYQALSRKETV